MSVPEGSAKDRIFTLVAAGSLGLAFLALLFFYGADVNLVLLAAAATILVLVGLVTWRKSPLGHAESVCVLVATVALVLSQLQSLSPETGLPATWVVAMVILAYVVGRALGERMRFVWVLLGVVGVGIGLVSAWNLVVHGERPGLPLTDYNNFAALMYVLLLPLVDHLLTSRETKGSEWRDWLGLSLVGIATLLIAASGSRAGLWIALGGVTFLVIGRRRDPVRRPLAIRISIAAILGVVIFQAGLDHSDSSLQNAETLSGGLAIRSTLIETAWSMRPDNPLSGLGVLVFPLLYRQVRGPEDPDTAGLFVHNDYVQLYIETGVLLFLPLLALCAQVLLRLRRSWKDGTARSLEQGAEKGQVDGAFGAGFALALGGLLVHALVNFIFYTASLSMLAGLLAASTVASLRGERVTRYRRTGRLLLAPPALLAVIGLAYLWLDVTTAAILKGQPGFAWTDSIASDPERQLQYAWRAQSLNPDRGTPFLAAAMISTHRLGPTPAEPGAAHRVLEDWRRAVSADPWNTHALWQFRAFILGTPGVAASLRQEEAPDELLERMLVLDPIFIPAIDAVLTGFASRPDAVSLQTGFLERHLGERLMWMAREDREAAAGFARFLVARSESAERRAHWAEVLRRIEAWTPLAERRWFF